MMVLPLVSAVALAAFRPTGFARATRAMFPALRRCRRFLRLAGLLWRYLGDNIAIIFLVFFDDIIPGRHYRTVVVE